LRLTVIVNPTDKIPGILLSRGLPAMTRFRIPLVLGAMHLAWATGFLTSPRHLHRESDMRVGQPAAAAESPASAGRE
jgi:hypothetical protein